MKRLDRIASRLVHGGPGYDGVLSAAEWLEDYARTISGKSEELKKGIAVTKGELEGALHALQGVQRVEGRDERIEKISAEIGRLSSEVDDLNRVAAAVIKRMVVKLAEIERDTTGLQQELMRVRNQ